MPVNIEIFCGVANEKNKKVLFLVKMVTSWRGWCMPELK
jgi:hypothetical protein